jgi:hypothetical protein
MNLKEFDLKYAKLSKQLSNKESVKRINELNRRRTDTL